MRSEWIFLSFGALADVMTRRTPGSCWAAVVSKWRTDPKGMAAGTTAAWSMGSGASPG
jgi:hypothetical protein